MRLTILTSIIFLLSCSSKSSEDKRNHEAIILHNSMIKKANQIDLRLNELKYDSSVNQDSVMLLSKALEQWKYDLVEVPGNEEHNHDHHNHAHNDNKIPEVTEEQMLAIQRELDERLSGIGSRVINLKPTLNNEH